MKAIYLNVKEGKAPKIVDIKDDLQTFYKLIDCDIIDITTRECNNVICDIICDDEGLLKDNPIVSAINTRNQPELVGNLLICGYANSGGQLQGLTNSEILAVLSSFATVTTKTLKGEKIYQVLRLN